MKTSFVGPLCAALALALVPAPSLRAQTSEESILRILGASSLEELSETEIERFESLHSRPVPLNTASRSALRASGLFTPFQIASLLDYRLNSGDILSLTELGLVDGFSASLAGVLAPYISLESKAVAGSSSSRHPFSASLLLRNAVKADEGSSKIADTFGIKFKAGSEGLFEANAAWRGSPSGSLVYYGKRHLGKLVLGDYNARFGQGLAAWSGFSLSGFSGSSSFCRRASGISPTCSWSPAQRGLAADFDFGNISLSAAVSKDFLPLVNLTLLQRSATFSATCLVSPYSQTLVSHDALFSWGKWHPFYEVAFDAASSSVAALAGVQWEWSYKRRLSLLLRDYPASYKGKIAGPPRSSSASGGEKGLAVGLQRESLDLTFDAAAFEPSGTKRFKAVANLPLKLSGSLQLQLKAQYQYRPQEDYAHKASLRSDLVLSRGAWQYTARLHLQHCQGNALLSYLEAGRKGEKLQLWGRASAFAVQNWDDRIYVWERDAPGNFSVPAYYGTGGAVSFFGGWKTLRHRLYLRLSGIFYVNDKPSRLECRLQYNFYLPPR